MKENLTLEIVEERLKKIAKAHGLDLGEGVLFSPKF